MRTVFVENHDSFSWNVLDCLPVPRDELAIVDAAHAPAALDDARVLVIGPGPTDPERAGLVQVVRLAAARGIPLLGVCLGHQALGLACGATLVRSTPTHGKTALTSFLPSRLFPGVVGPLTVMRYHSLALTDVRAPLSTIGALADGTVMAVEHAELPMAGLQFHPDSYATPQGRALFEAFFRAVA